MAFTFATTAPAQVQVAQIDTRTIELYPSADGGRFITHTSDGLRFWDAKRAKILRSIDLPLGENPAMVSNSDHTKLYLVTQDGLAMIALKDGLISERITRPGIDLLYYDDRIQQLIACDNDLENKVIRIHRFDTDLKLIGSPIILPITSGNAYKAHDPYASDSGIARAILAYGSDQFLIDNSTSKDFINITDLKGDGYDGKLVAPRDSHTGDSLLNGALTNVGGSVISLASKNDRIQTYNPAQLHSLAPETLELEKTTLIEGNYNFPTGAYIAGGHTYHEPSQTLLITGGYTLYFYNLSSQTITKTLDTREAGLAGGNFYATFADASGERIYLADFETFVLYDLATETVAQNFNQGYERLNSIAVDPLTGELLVSDENLNLWRIGFDSNRLSIEKVDSDVDGLNVDAEAATLLIRRIPKEKIWGVDFALYLSTTDSYPKLSTLAAAKKWTANSIDINAAIFSPSGSLFTLAGTVGDSLSGEVILENDDLKSSYEHYRKGGAISRAVICQDDAIRVGYFYRAFRIGDSNNFSAKFYLVANDIYSGEILWEEAVEQARSPRPIQFDDDNALKVLYSNPMEVQLRNRDTGKVFETKLISKELPTATAPLKFSTDGSTLLYPVNDQTYIVDLYSDKVLGSFESNTSIRSWALLPSAEVLAVCANESTIRFIKRADATFLADLHLDADTKRWVVVDAESRFVMSDSLADEIYMVEGDTIQTAGQFMSVLYEPLLLEEILGTANTPAINRPAFGQTDLPKVSLALANGTRGLVVEDDIVDIATEQSAVRLTVSASGVNLDSTDLRLYHNGKLLGAGTRGLFVEDDDSTDSATFRERSFTVPLLPGENRFRALAVNADGIESMPAEMRLTSSSPDAETGGKGLRLFTLFIGIDEYTNIKYNLNYAVADAEALAAKFTQKNQGTFTSIENRILLNADATRANILAAFAAIGAEISPRDAFVFYFAGHGVVDSGDFYLAPTELKQLYGDTKALQTNGISATELRELSANLAAQKQLFLLDACQSAEALVTIAQRGSAAEKAIAQLARSTGTHWLTASGSDQFATEFAELGHGAFTYAILQALDGAADSGDGLVSVNELKAYLESAVPELTATHRGSAQYPASFGSGQDFPISLP
jgi:hypothetical protein